jgi:hypothetical protein
VVTLLVYGQSWGSGAEKRPGVVLTVVVDVIPFTVVVVLTVAVVVVDAVVVVVVAGIAKGGRGQ